MYAPRMPAARTPGSVPPTHPGLDTLQGSFASCRRYHSSSSSHVPPAAKARGAAVCPYKHQGLHSPHTYTAQGRFGISRVTCLFLHMQKKTKKRVHHQSMSTAAKYVFGKTGTGSFTLPCSCVLNLLNFCGSSWTGGVLNHSGRASRTSCASHASRASHAVLTSTAEAQDVCPLQYAGRL